MNTLVQLLLWYLAAFGFALVLGHSQITVGFRRWLAPTGDGADTAHTLSPHPTGAFRGSRFLCELIECPMCLGFWQGLILGALLGKLPGFNYSESYLVIVWSTPATNWVLARLSGVV